MSLCRSLKHEIDSKRVRCSYTSASAIGVQKIETTHNVNRDTIDTSLVVAYFISGCERPTVGEKKLRSRSGYG